MKHFILFLRHMCAHKCWVVWITFHLHINAREYTPLSRDESPKSRIVLVIPLENNKAASAFHQVDE